MGTLILAALLLAGLQPADARRAQSDARVRTTGGIALVTASPGAPATSHAVGPVERGYWTLRFARMESAPAQPEAVRVSAVQFHYILAGDGVRVRVSALVGMPHREERPIATVTVPPWQEVVVSELQEYGIEPMTLSTAPIAPVLVAVPETRNATTGLEIAAVDVLETDVPTYRITVRNRSDQAARAIWVQMYGPSGRLSLTGYRREAHGAPVILPGGRYVFDVRSPRLVRTPTGLRPGPFSRIAIESVVWADGTYEGDATSAAKARLADIGRSLQLARLIPLLTSALFDETGPIGDQTVARLTSAIDALAIEPDLWAAVGTLSRAPLVAVLSREEAESVLRVSMQQVKREALADLRGFTDIHGGTSDRAALTDWLAATAARYQDWLARVQPRSVP